MQKLLWGAVACFLLALGQAAEGLPGQQARSERPLRFFDLAALGLEGKGWADTARPYDRLPARAQTQVPAAVWSLSRHSAGLCARFVTDATQLTAHWVLTSGNLAMPHMPATGVSGVDLYVRLASGSWRWVANGQPTQQTNTVRLFQGVRRESREFCLYLPLYNGVSQVTIGIPADATLVPAPDRPKPNRAPLVFYGTSITQGGCASRPGTAHPAIIGRALNRPVINLGFSGNGKMEPALADLLAELSPAVFILDCVPNMNGPMIEERVVPFVQRLRRAHPDTPILLVEDRTYADAFFKSDRAERNREDRLALKQAFDRLQAEGVKQLHYLPGDKLLGGDGDDTVDGSHPTDLGFRRQADAFLQALKPLLSTRDRPPRTPREALFKVP